MDHRSASITPGGSQFMPDGRSPLNRTRPLDGQRPGGGGPFHSQSIEMRFVKTPGIKCVVPASSSRASDFIAARNVAAADFCESTAGWIFGCP